MRAFFILTAALLLSGCGEQPPGQRELENGVRDLRRGNFNAARTQLEKSIAARPGSEQNLEAYNYLGIASWQLGKSQDALEAFESARRLSPIAAEPTYNLGVLCAETGDQARALQLLKEAALMDEKDPRPLEYMGALYARRQQWPEARRSYYAARSRAPASPRILTAIALVEMQTERPETAVASLLNALGHDARYAPALFNLGVIYQTRLNDPQQARPYFEKFLGLTNSGPQVDYVRRVLAGAAASAAPVTAAAPTPGLAPVTPVPSTPAPVVTPLPPAGTDALTQAREAAERGKMEDALNFCLQAAAQAAARNDRAAQEKALRLGVQLCLDQPRAHTELGQFLNAQGQYDAALKAFKAAITLNDSYAPAFLGLGRAATATREFDTALVGLKQAVKADPTNADALWLLAQLYDRSLEMGPAAVKSYSDFLKLFPSDSRAALARERVRTLGVARRPAVSEEAAVAAATRPAPAPTPAPVTRPPVAPAPTPAPTRQTVTFNQPPQTLPAAPRAEDVNPDTAATARPAASGTRNAVAARQALSRAAEYQQRNDWNNALYYYEQAVRNDDRLDPAWYNLGVGYSLRGDAARAKDAYLHVLELKPDYAEARYNLAVLYLDTQDYAAAEKTLTDLVQRKPNYANAYLALGQIYARNAATVPQAKAAYQQFLTLAPNDRSAASVRQWLRAAP